MGDIVSLSLMDRATEELFEIGKLLDVILDMKCKIKCIKTEW